MARRPPPPDPEVAALARDRLARVLGDDTIRPRRSVEPAPVALGPRPVGLEDLEPPRRFTRWHAGVVAAVLLVGLVWGGWSWLQARPEAVAAPPAVQTADVPGAASTPPGATPVGGTPAGAAPAGAAPSSAQPSAAAIVVHVLGAVRHPGLVRLPAGARVQDALEAAGGLRGDADPGELNLAQPLEDGVQVVVGTRAHPEGEVRSAGGSGAGSGTPGPARSTQAGGGMVDLNSATVDQLDTLPGVGPVTAQKILDWRAQHGRFARADELQEVDGIGPKTYARIAPHVRV